MAEYDTAAAEKEMSKVVVTTFKNRSEFVCFLFAFEQKFTPFTVSHLLHTSILAKLNSLTLETLENQAERTKEQHERALKLIALNRLLNETLQMPFGRMTQSARSEFPLLGLH